jgi:hypothetical protein
MPTLRQEQAEIDDLRPLQAVCRVTSRPQRSQNPPMTWDSSRFRHRHQLAATLRARGFEDI